MDGLLTQDAVMHVDLDHPRVTAGAGEPVFLPQGGNTPYLDHIAGVLRGIHEEVPSRPICSRCLTTAGSSSRSRSTCRSRRTTG